MHDERAVAGIAALARGSAPRCGPVRVVAVDGPSGSGKTTLADEVAARLGGAPVLHMDDLYPGWDGLADAVPSLHDQVLAPLARGERAAYRRFDWGAGRFAEWHEVPPVPLLVVEGVGCSAGPCADLEVVHVWVEAERDVRFARGIARDGAAYRPHWERWALQEERLFARDATRSRAHVVLDTSRCSGSTTQ